MDSVKRRTVSWELLSNGTGLVWLFVIWSHGVNCFLFTGWHLNFMFVFLIVYFSRFLFCEIYGA